MKRFAVVLLVSVFAFGLGACDQASISIVDGVRATRIDTPRVDGEHELNDYEVVVIESREALVATIESTTDHDLGYKAHGDSVAFVDFTDAFDEAYFASNIIILIIIDEFSQSVRHRVADVHSDQGQLGLHVERLIPPVHVDALGSWHLVVELDRERFDADTVDVRMTTYQEMPYEGGFNAARTWAPYDEVSEGLYIIETHEALLAYLEANEATFNFDSTFGGHASFRDVVGQYDEAYFATRKLAFVVVVEASGSNYHRFIEPRFLEDGTLELRFERVTPIVGTTDIAIWHLIVELDKGEHAADNVVTRFTDTYLDDSAS